MDEDMKAQLDQDPVKEQQAHWQDQIDNRKARRRRAALERKTNDQ